MLSDATSDVGRLTVLERFWADVWGNEHILMKRATRQSGSDSRTLEFLDFGGHVEAVELFCPAIRGERLLLIVDEYREAMKNFQFEGDPPPYKRGACITGQPGIGKSCFIAYAVLELLGKKKPAAIQPTWRLNHYLLFSEDGVTLHNRSDFVPLESHPGIWAFSDSNEVITIPLVSFKLAAGVRVFQTTSPDRKRFRKWTTEHSIRLYIMDIWSDEEIGDLAFISGHKDNRMSDLAKKWGPVPRTLKMLYEAPQCEEMLEENITAAVNEVVEKPRHIRSAFVFFERSLLAPELSIVFIMRTKHEDQSHRLQFATVPTCWLLGQLVKAVVAQEDDNKRKEFFDVMSSALMTLPAASQVYEQYLRHYLARGEHVTVQWYDPKTLLAFPHDVIFPVLLSCTDLNETTIDPPSYWLSNNHDFLGINGLIVTPACVYLLQVTLDDKQPSPQEGVDRMWQSMPTLRHLPWKFLFIGVVDNQIRGVSSGYVNKLRVGPCAAAITRKRKRQESFSKTNLPVGQAVIY